jgi:hypothetical protein
LTTILKLQRSQEKTTSSNSAKQLGATHITPIHIVIGSCYRQSAIAFASKTHEFDDTASASQKKRVLAYYIARDARSAAEAVNSWLLAVRRSGLPFDLSRPLHTTESENKQKGDL